MAKTLAQSAAVMAVEVRSLSGNVILLTEVQASDRVATVKSRVQVATEVEVDKQQLLWHASILKDCDVLGELVASKMVDGKLEGGSVDATMVLQLCVLPDLPESAEIALRNAAAALDCLDKKSLGELKGFGKPPCECVDVCSACAFLLRNEKKKQDWKYAQKMMTNPAAFLNECKAFNAKVIPGQSLANVEQLLQMPFFNYDVMKGKSLAAANLASWVINVVSYHRLYLEVVGGTHENMNYSREA
jgi:hypothetical protein